MLELIGKLNGYAQAFARILREDPLKAAGIVALGYVALRALIAVLRVLWKLRWIIAIGLVIVGVAYVFRDKEVPLLTSEEPADTGIAESAVPDIELEAA